MFKSDERHRVPEVIISPLAYSRNITRLAVLRLSEPGEHEIRGSLQNTPDRRKFDEIDRISAKHGRFEEAAAYPTQADLHSQQPF
jgi:hypothetical protein